MKLHKLFFVYSALAIIFLIGLTGCPTEDTGDEDPPPPPPDPIAGNPSGTWDATADGFASSAPAYLAENSEFGRPITVTVTVVEGYITEVVIDGPDETINVGKPAINSAPAKIIAKNSFNIDKVTGATFTSNGIKNAGNAALAKIPVAQ